jgi:hypothetical protein
MLQGGPTTKLVARRTGADGLFILPQGHALHDAGRHAKAKNQKPPAPSPPSRQAEPEGRRNRETTLGRCQPSTVNRDRPPRPEVLQAKQHADAAGFVPGSRANRPERVPLRLVAPVCWLQSKAAIDNTRTTGPYPSANACRRNQGKSPSPALCRCASSRPQLIQRRSLLPRAFSPIPYNCYSIRTRIVLTAIGVGTRHCS